ncbi:hypothetical protein BH11ACT3_BH11ACT3_18510 [soil metagenome]
MTTVDDAAVGLRSTLLFGATGLIAAITVAALQVSGWHAGSLDNRVEWIFWAGAILGAAGIGLLGVAAIPGRPGERLIPAGMVLFLVAPVLCVVAVFADYWI